MNDEISKDPKLNDISFTLSEGKLPEGMEKTKFKPGYTQKEKDFKFVFPYRQHKGFIKFARNLEGWEDFNVSKEVTPEFMFKVLKTYIENQYLPELCDEKSNVMAYAEVDELKPKIYTRARKALRGKPLNAAEISGVITEHYMKKRHQGPFTLRVNVY